MPSQCRTPDGGLGKSTAASWDSEDEVKFVDTDGDTNVFRLSEGERIDLEVNGELCLQDLLTCRLEARTLFLQSAGSRKTTVTTVPKGQEEVVLRVMALLAKRCQSTSMVEFVDAEGRTAVLRLSDASLLELHVDGKKCLNDIFSCRLDGPNRRVLHLKGEPLSGKATLTVPEGQEEVITRILALVQKRGMIEGEVEFVDTDGDTNLFRLTEGGCLELYVNKELREIDMSDVTLDVIDGRTLHCRAANSKWATLTTVPPGHEEVALCILALFHKRGEPSKEDRRCVSALPARGATQDGCLAKGPSPTASTPKSSVVSTDIPSGHSLHAAESRDGPCLQRVENLEVTSRFGMGYSMPDLHRSNSDLERRKHWMLTSVEERKNGSGSLASLSGLSSGRNSTGTTDNSLKRSSRRRYWMLT